MKLFNICALNVNGFRDRTSDPKMMAILRNFQNEDIACLLDTRLDPTLWYKIKHNWHGKVLFAHNELGSGAGIAILFKNHLTPVKNVSRDPGGRYISFQTTIDNHALICCAVYAPAVSLREHKTLFKQLKQNLAAQATPDHCVVLLRDFNMTENPIVEELWWKSSDNNRIDPSLNQFRILTTELQIEDLWRIRHPRTKSFTFTSAAQRGARTWIDRVYTSRTSRGKNPKTLYEN